MRNVSLIVSLIGLFSLSACGGNQVLQNPQSNPVAAASRSQALNVLGTATIFAANNFCGPGGPCVGGSVSGYPISARGNVSPALNLTGFDRPFAVAYHAGLVYVASFNGNDGTASIKIYSRATQALVRSVSGPSTDLVGGPLGIAVDRAGYIYVTIDSLPNSHVDIFSPSATGNVAPVRQIVGPNTKLANNDPWGIALDPQGNIYVVLQQNMVLMFAAGASGDATPMRIITATPGLNDPIAVAVDDEYDIFVTNNGSRTVTIFAPALKKKPNLFATIGGSKTGLGDILGIAVDSKTIYVANASNNSIEMFQKCAKGNIAPFATIQGNATLLNGPLGLAVSSE